MIIPWWGILVALSVIAVLIAKIFHLLFRIEKLEEMVRRLEGIDEERREGEDVWEEFKEKKKSILELDDIEERRDSGGG